MNIHCEVIKDLLPLYMEDMASEESTKLVEDHLTTCSACEKELEEMKAARVTPVQTDSHILHQVKVSIIKRRLFTAFTAVMIVISVYLGFTEFLNADIWIPGEVAIECVEQDSDGNLTVYTNYSVNGSGVSWDYNGDHVAFIASMRMKEYLLPKDSAQEPPYNEHSIGVERAQGIATSMDITEMGYDGVDLSNHHFWYVNIWDGTAGMPLWATEDVEAPADPIIEISYILFYYCGALLLMGIVLAAVSTRKSNKPVLVTSILCFCLIIGTILTCGGQLVTYYNSAPWKIRDSLIVVLPLFVTILCTLKLYSWKKKDDIV